METTVASLIPLLGSRLHWIGLLKESFLLDLEENLSLGRVEKGVREPQDGLLSPFRSPSRGSWTGDLRKIQFKVRYGPCVFLLLIFQR
ncbi:hypothetical protein B296_00010440 [Ensete ventricosum]|uniref:Uncharacterized protein n=1 Tax=Ensete ventricosum TaxID=4639 RepID=A0A426YI00_ENSVE|nr:hypothetical protein B296_00010440 [Ensete ventricosum]